MKKTIFDEKLQNMLIMYAAVAPAMASPLYFMGYLGWAMSGGSHVGSLRERIFFMAVPATSIAILGAVTIFGQVTARRGLAMVIALTFNVAELAFAAKLTGLSSLSR